MISRVPRNFLKTKMCFRSNFLRFVATVNEEKEIINVIFILLPIRDFLLIFISLCNCMYCEDKKQN